MKRLLFAVLAMFFVIGCGTVNRTTPEQMEALQNVSQKAPPSTVDTAQHLNTNTLQDKLNALVASGQLTTAQAAALADPKNQTMIQSLVTLAQGGTVQARSDAANMLMTAASSTGKSTNDTLTTLLGLLNTMAPIIATLDPQLAPFIQIAETILPIILTLFGGATTV